MLVPSCGNVEVRAEPPALRAREDELDVTSWLVVVVLSLRVEDTVWEVSEVAEVYGVAVKEGDTWTLLLEPVVADSLKDEELDVLSLPIPPVRLDDVVGEAIDVDEAELVVELWMGTTGNSESEDATDPVAERTVERYLVSIMTTERWVVALSTYLVLAVRLGDTAPNLF